MVKTNVRLNRNVRYLLLLVDQFTKKLFCAPVYGGGKSAPAVIQAFKDIFSTTTSRPNKLYTDQGSEFVAKPVKEYLQHRQNIATFTTKDKDIKCSIVERSIRTLKGRLFTFIDAGHPRYLSSLQHIVNGINNSAGRTTNVAPNQVDPINALALSAARHPSSTAGASITSSAQRDLQRQRLDDHEEGTLSKESNQLLKALMHRFNIDWYFFSEDVWNWIECKGNKINEHVAFMTKAVISFVAICFLLLCIIASTISAFNAASHRLLTRVTTNENNTLHALKQIMGQGGSCCCTVRTNHSSCWCTPADEKHPHHHKERQDTWKMHICDLPCIDCERLYTGCKQFNAEGACRLFNVRCQEVHDPDKRREYNLCEPGCLDCVGMRYGCYYHQDPGQCIIYNTYCKENSLIHSQNGGMKTTTVQREFLAKFAADVKETLLSMFESGGTTAEERLQQRERAKIYMQKTTTSCAVLEYNCAHGGGWLDIAPSTMYSNALGQEGEDVITFKVVSNTTDFAHNNPSSFGVNPYGGVEFDRRFPWNISSLGGSIPFNLHPSVGSDLWFKRIQIPSDESYASHYNTIFTKNTYDKVISASERMSFPSNRSKSLLMGKTANTTIPQEFVNFFNTKYINRMGTSKMWDVHPLLTIVKSPELTTEADDIFEFDIKRTEEDGDKRSPPAAAENEMGYIEIIRMSRSMEILLGLNVNDALSNANHESRSFPQFTQALPGLHLTHFSPATFATPPLTNLRTLIKSATLTESGFWGNLLKHFNIPAVIIKLHQSYTDEEPFQGGNLASCEMSPNTYLNYQFTNQEQSRKEQYSDYFVATILKKGESLKTLYYGKNLAWSNTNIPVKHNNPHMMEFTRGTPWSVSQYLRHPQGISFTAACDFIEDNVYSGLKEKTLLSEEVPINIGKQSAYTKFNIPLRYPLTNKFNISNYITLSFTTKRRLRSSLHLTLSKSSKFKYRRVRKNEVQLKAFRFPIQLTLRAAAKLNG
eukprot:Seg2628.12 transcript_id=Seg2628.12/GoldUCD/mRNA.D3Y31 product="putative transposon-derived protein F54H12.3" protein_id=Seg2628.12/GoldUCD/D3Y31